MLSVPSALRDSGLGPTSMPWGTGNNYDDDKNLMRTSKSRRCMIEARRIHRRVE